MLNITTLAAWGEFVGGIAVVISLVYLASQIRQNSKLHTRLRWCPLGARNANTFRFNCRRSHVPLLLDGTAL